MINIRLLGGAKKAVGKTAISFDTPGASLLEILKFLTTISSQPGLLQPCNLIITLNGVDCASLRGYDTVAKSGDTVTIVTVVHGGTECVIDGYHVSINGVSSITQDPGKLVDGLRAQYNNASIQPVNANAVYGEEHVRGVMKIVLEAKRRKIMLANKPEMELLIRLAGTNQIAEAIKSAGLQRYAPGCFIAFSQHNEPLRQFESQIKNDFQLNNFVLKPSKEKRDRFASKFGFAARLDDNEILLCLLEKAAILVK